MRERLQRGVTSSCTFKDEVHLLLPLQTWALQYGVMGTASYAVGKHIGDTGAHAVAAAAAAAAAADVGPALWCDGHSLLPCGQLRLCCPAYC
jgi:hypothetical protein